MKMWLLIFKDGTFMPWRTQIPRGSDFEKGTRLFETSTITTLGEISDWYAYAMPDVSWLKEKKEW